MICSLCLHFSGDFDYLAPLQQNMYPLQKRNTLPKMPPKPESKQLKHQFQQQSLISLPGTVLNSQSTKNLNRNKPPKKSNEISTTNLRQLLNNLNIFSSGAKHASNATSSSFSMNNQSRCYNGNGVLQPKNAFSHSNLLTASMNSHHSRCSEGSSHRSRMGSHRSRSITRASDTDSNSTKSLRRPSVDTVSTYLSHESKESLRSRNFTFSVNDLLDCSLGSDEVFVPISERPPPPPPPLPTQQQHLHQQQMQLQHKQQIAGSIVGVDPASDMISRFVKVVNPPQWPNAQPCPMCMEELVHNSRNPAISLSRCHHLMHLQCLNEMIIENQKDTTKVSLFVSNVFN